MLLEKPCRGKPENWESVAGPAALRGGPGACRPLLAPLHSRQPAHLSRLTPLVAPKTSCSHLRLPSTQVPGPFPKPLSNSAVACPSFPETAVLGCSPQKTLILIPGPLVAYPGLQAALAPWNSSSSGLLGSNPTWQKPYTGTSSRVTRCPVCPSPTRRVRKEDFKSVCLGC